ncbi:MAG: six-hairpin glycosidase, partial [Limisphaerales bacterium]
MRGLAEWADDGTFADTKQAMWLVYSVNKEDIWVSRVPLPVKPDETAFPADDFAKATPGAAVPGWNLYSPKWAPASVVETAGKRSLELRDGDPFDYARAVRVFPESAKVRAEVDLTPGQAGAGLEIELCDAVGHRPVRVLLTETGLVQAVDGNTVTDLGKYAAGEKLSLTIAADATAGRYSVQVNGGAARELAVAEADART